MNGAPVKEATADSDILRCYPVMRELRPHVKSADEFLARIRRQQAQSDWRLIYVEDSGIVAACSGFRISEWLVSGKTLYVDDLICLESHRGKGFAEALMVWMEEFARKRGCAELHLDSGTHRLGAHRFYHRLKLVIASFHFQKKL